MLNKLLKELKKASNPVRAKASMWFFKTGKGQYGEGDVFVGLSVPQQRIIAKKYSRLPLQDIQKLLESKIHEHRLIGLIILVNQFQKSDEAVRNKIFNFYLKNARRVNNWDLVDSSAPYIVGEHLFDKNKSILYKLAQSENLWEKRISILATFAFIKRNQFFYALKISSMLLADKHDLIHKAVGWMLREVGKRDIIAEEEFLKKYYKIMPRTTLRYAIEKFPKLKQKQYLHGKIS